MEQPAEQPAEQLAEQPAEQSNSESEKLSLQNNPWELQEDELDVIPPENPFPQPPAELKYKHVVIFDVSDAHECLIAASIDRPFLVPLYPNKDVDLILSTIRYEVTPGATLILLGNRLSKVQISYVLDKGFGMAKIFGKESELVNYYELPRSNELTFDSRVFALDITKINYYDVTSPNLVNKILADYAVVLKVPDYRDDYINKDSAAYLVEGMELTKKKFINLAIEIIQSEKYFELLDEYKSAGKVVVKYINSIIEKRIERGSLLTIEYDNVKYHTCAMQISDNVLNTTESAVGKTSASGLVIDLALAYQPIDPN